MTTPNQTDFDDIVNSYMEAAQMLGLTRDDVDMAVRKATRFVGQCSSCRHSRAPPNAVSIAMLENRLPIHTRQCTREPPHKRCPNWEALDLPVPVLP